MSTSRGRQRVVASLRCQVKSQPSFLWMKGFFWILDPTTREVVPRLPASGAAPTAPTRLVVPAMLSKSVRLLI